MPSSVLLVDDEPDLLSAVSEGLGWRVPSSLEALDLLRYQHYHALITDLRMPHLDGMALLAAVKAITEERRKPSQSTECM